MGGTDDLVIRPLARSDWADWKRLWTAYLHFYGTDVGDNVKTTYFDRLLGDDPRDYAGLVATLGDTPVGLTHYLFHRHGWKLADTCYLQDLYADEAARGKGVGRALIEAVYDAADAAGVDGVYWLTQDFNATARQLYDRIGEVTPFIKYQRKPVA